MLKGEMSMLNVLLLEELDMQIIEAELQEKHNEAPQFFQQSPLIVDCHGVADKLADRRFDFSLLKDVLIKTGFIPVGLRNAPAKMNAQVVESGWALMRPTPKPINVSKPKEIESEPIADQLESKPDSVEEAPAVVTTKASMIIERPVRSGQQIYAADADMTVLAATSAGSEIVADGSIHIYGALRGRALAGARGNESARIYCHSLQAELIAIAGRYLLLDESDTALKGKPAMIRLEGEKLMIEALVK